jgi:hypothetical protein
MNLYTYTRNDPVNSIDVSGRETIFIGGGGEGYGLTSIVDKYAKAIIPLA